MHCGTNNYYSLILNADDLGYCYHRDSGIFELFKNDVVSFASLIVNGLSSESAAQIATSNNYPVGLHLNLTEGFPISKASDIQTIVDSDGALLGKFGLRKAIEENTVDINHIATETVAQFIHFKKLTNKFPNHFDGHQHVHVIPQLVDLIASTVKQFDVKSTRIATLNYDDINTRQSKVTSFMKEISDQSRKAKSVYEKYDIVSNNVFLGHTTMGANVTLPAIKKQISNAVKSYKYYDSSANGNNIICEWMVHPGYASPVGIGDDFSQSKEREHELAFLKENANKLKLIAKDNNFKMNNWNFINSDSIIM